MILVFMQNQFNPIVSLFYSAKASLTQFMFFNFIQKVFKTSLYDIFFYAKLV